MRPRASKDFVRDERGAVLLLVTVAIVTLIGFAGLAIDAGHTFAVESRLIQAVDAAALAGGKLMHQRDRRVQEIARVLDANFPNPTLGASIVARNQAFDDDRGRVTVTASASFPTTFMSVFGHPTSTVTARSVVVAGEHGMEVVLVMDNTGSMYGGGKIGAMKSAARDLVEILYGDRDEIRDSNGRNIFWIGLVPYTSAVNIGPQRIGWLANPADTTSPFGAAAGTPAPQWRGCVEAESGTWDRTEAVTAGTLVPYRFPSLEFINPYQTTPAQIFTTKALDERASTNTTSNKGVGPNLGCGPALTPMQRSKANVLAAIDRMNSWHRGGTATNLGLLWGWRMLSEGWRTVWQNADASDMAADGLPLAYGTPRTDKVAIILTDGVNQNYTCTNDCGAPTNTIPDYSAYGMASQNRLGLANPISASQWAQKLDQRMLEICTAMKARDIILYTITFQVSSQSVKTLFRNCASDPGKYFDDGTNADLSDTFRRIAEELRRLRLAE